MFLVAVVLLCTSLALAASAVGADDTDRTVAPDKFAHSAHSQPGDSWVEGQQESTDGFAIAGLPGEATDESADQWLEFVSQNATQFNVTITELNESVSVNEPLAVVVEVENIGEEVDSQQISLEVAGEEANSTTLQLNSSESRQVTLTWNPNEGVVGTRTIVVQSGTDADSQPVEVERLASQEPTQFNVTITELNESVSVNERLTVVVEVENTGDEAASQRISLEAAGEEVENTTLQLNASESRQITLTWTPDEGVVGTHTIVIQSETDADSQPVEVEHGESESLPGPVPLALLLLLSFVPFVVGVLVSPKVRPHIVGFVTAADAQEETGSDNEIHIADVYSELYGVSDIRPESSTDDVVRDNIDESEVEFNEDPSEQKEAILEDIENGNIINRRYMSSPDQTIEDRVEEVLSSHDVQNPKTFMERLNRALELATNGDSHPLGPPDDLADRLETISKSTVHLDEAGENLLDTLIAYGEGDSFPEQVTQQVKSTVVELSDRQDKITRLENKLQQVKKKREDFRRKLTGLDEDLDRQWIVDHSDILVGSCDEPGELTSQARDEGVVGEQVALVAAQRVQGRVDRGNASFGQGSNPYKFIKQVASATTQDTARVENTLEDTADKLANSEQLDDSDLKTEKDIEHKYQEVMEAANRVSGSHNVEAIEELAEQVYLNAETLRDGALLEPTLIYERLALLERLLTELSRDTGQAEIDNAHVEQKRAELQSDIHEIDYIKDGHEISYWYLNLTDEFERLARDASDRGDEDAAQAYLEAEYRLVDRIHEMYKNENITEILSWK
jgi:hypothetical protein